jgi:hypothetical protein
MEASIQERGMFCPLAEQEHGWKPASLLRIGSCDLKRNVV